MTGSINPSGSAIAATPMTSATAARTSTPAVLRGRSAASPGSGGATGQRQRCRRVAGEHRRQAERRQQHDAPPHRPHHDVPRGAGERPAQGVVVGAADEEAADDEHQADGAGGPQQRSSHGRRGPPALARHDDGDDEADESEQRQQPGQHVEGASDGDRRVGERLVTDRCQRHREFGVGDGGALGGDGGEHAGDDGADVGDAQGDRIAVALGERPVGGLDGGSRRAGQQVAAGDPGGDRLDERTDRHEVGVGDDEAGGDRRAESGGDVVVAADLVDVAGERRPVEQLAVEVPGDQPQSGEDRPERRSGRG